MEQRQCTRWGEATDAAMMADAYVRGQTALMNSKQIKVLKDMVLHEQDMRNASNPFLLHIKLTACLRQQ